MSAREPNREGPGYAAALAARGEIEATLFALPDIPLALDRIGVRDRLLRAIQYLYAVLDNAVIATVHLDGLNEGASMVAETRALLAAAGDPAAIAALGVAVEHLARAEAALRRGAQAVAEIQLARRAELATGQLDAALPPARPFRASVGVPRLHAIARPPLLPHVVVEPRAPLPEAPPPPVHIAPPKSIEELAAFAADAASGALVAKLEAPSADAAPPPPPEPLPFPYEPAVGEAEVLRRVGRDCLEDIATYRSLRKPNAIETWLDQGPFEQRLLDNIDAFAALGGAVLPLAALFHAESEVPDAERGFAVALTLGCIEGSDTVGAAVITLQQSAPEELDGWREGFWLAPNPAIDVAMADLCTRPRLDLVTLALDVLHARGPTPDEVVRALLDRAEPEIAWRVARALARSLPEPDAVDRLERLADAEDDDVALAAVESLLRRGQGGAVDRLRRAVDDASAPARAARAAALLCLVGGAGDVDRLLGALTRDPAPRLLRAVGRFGHVESLGALAGLLEHEDEETVAAAAEALERITGAGLRETVEEPWEIELPPEATAEGAIPVPLRTVERIVVDPERWSAWIREKARRLDAKLKTRGGAPFTPLQIVAELEAKTTPPPSRAEAALELGLVAAVPAAFSPDDWVARQRSHLADLRAQVTATPATPGGFPSFARRHAARRAVAAAPPAPPRERAVAAAPPPVPPRRDEPAPLPAVAAPPIELNATANVVLSPEMIAAFAKRAALPFAGTPAEAQAPAGAAAPRPPVDRPASSPPPAPAVSPPVLQSGELGATAAVDISPEMIAALAKQAALPFAGAPAEPQAPVAAAPRPPAARPVSSPPPAPAAPPPVLQSGELGATAAVDLSPEMVARFAEGALPFAQGSAAAAPAPAPPAPAAKVPAAPAAPPLANKPAVLKPPSGLLRTGAVVLTPALKATFAGKSPLPFQEARPASEAPAAPVAAPPAAPSAPPAAPAATSSPPAAAVLALTLEQYASLCAELSVFAGQQEAVFGRYGLIVLRERLAVDLSWQTRLRGDPALYQAWQDRYRHYVAYWTDWRAKNRP